MGDGDGLDLLYLAAVLNGIIQPLLRLLVLRLLVLLLGLRRVGDQIHGGVQCLCASLLKLLLVLLRAPAWKLVVEGFP